MIGNKKILNKLYYYIAYKFRQIFSKPKSKGKSVVVMIDGERYHGGLTDRFRHIMSVYYFCVQHSLEFRLYYTYPCDIQKIFTPADYDWRILKSELSYSFKDSKDVLVYSCYKSTGSSKEAEMERHQRIMEKMLLNNDENYQFHVYGNCYFAESHFFNLFHELFKPSPLLQKKMDELLSKHSEYESVVFRFQMLLGDYYEGNFTVLNENERAFLIEKCIDKIRELHDSGYFLTQQILVTSDSSTFLEAVTKRLDYVFIIPGENIHMEYVKKNKEDDNAFLKSFVDLLMLSKGKRITRLKTSIMYDSGFPEFSARIGNILYNKIDF